MRYLLIALAFTLIITQGCTQQRPLTDVRIGKMQLSCPTSELKVGHAQTCDLLIPLLEGHSAKINYLPRIHSNPTVDEIIAYAEIIRIDADEGGPKAKLIHAQFTIKCTPSGLSGPVRNIGSGMRTCREPVPCPKTVHHGVRIYPAEWQAVLRVPR